MPIAMNNSATKYLGDGSVIIGTAQRNIAMKIINTGIHVET